MKTLTKKFGLVKSMNTEAYIYGRVKNFILNNLDFKDEFLYIFSNDY
jgi:hypothetical protein